MGNIHLVERHLVDRVLQRPKPQQTPFRVGRDAPLVDLRGVLDRSPGQTEANLLVPDVVESFLLERVSEALYGPPVFRGVRPLEDRAVELSHEGAVRKRLRDHRAGSPIPCELLLRRGEEPASSFLSICGER